MPPPDPIRNADGGRGWHLRPRRLRVLRVLSGLLGAAFAVAGPLLWSAGGAMSLLVTFMGLAFLLLAWPPRRQRLEAHTVVHDRTPGLLIPVSRPSLGRVLVDVVVGALLVVLGPLAASEQQAWQALGASPLGALLAYVGYVGLRLRTLPHRGVLLLPDAVVLQTRLDSTRIPWSEIRKIRAHWTRWRRGFRSPDEPVRNWLSFELRGEPLGALDPEGRPRSPWVEPTALAVDPEVALSVIRYYQEHPAHRDELGSERAVERIRSRVVSARRS